MIFAALLFDSIFTKGVSTALVENAVAIILFSSIYAAAHLAYA